MKLKKVSNFSSLDAVHMKRASLVRKMSLEKWHLATVVKTASPLSMISIFPGEMSPENLNA